MKFYLAPLEGLTTYVYRNVYHHFSIQWINILLRLSYRIQIVDSNRKS